MARIDASTNRKKKLLIRIAGLTGTLGVALLAGSCGENTEKVLSKPVSNAVSASGGAVAATTGGTSSMSSATGGVTTGGVASTVIGTGGISTGGIVSTGGVSSTNTLAAMSAAGTPIGFAAVGGNGPTTGGGRLPPDKVTTCDNLRLLLVDDVQRVVVIDNITIDCAQPPTPIRTCQFSCDSTTGDTTTQTYRFLDYVSDNATTDCSTVSGGTASTPIDTTKTRNDLPIYVNSNKTLIGTGPNSTIKNATLYLNPTTSNVIIQNLNLTNVNPTILEAGDAITIDGANHVWVDHCNFSLISDGFIDTPSSASTTSATSITISWNHFNGRNPSACAGQHNYTNTIENSNVTFHHNFYDHTLGCGPKITKTSARIHLFNNYWQNALYYSIGVDKGAQALIEDNYFQDSLRPYWGMNTCISKGNCAISDSSGSNKFGGTSLGPSENKDTGGTVTPLPYDSSTYQLEDAGVLPTEIPQRAGPTLP